MRKRKKKGRKQSNCTVVKTLDSNLSLQRTIRFYQLNGTNFQFRSYVIRHSKRLSLLFCLHLWIVSRPSRSELKNYKL